MNDEDEKLKLCEELGISPEELNLDPTDKDLRGPGRQEMT